MSQTPVYVSLNAGASLVRPSIGTSFRTMADAVNFMVGSPVVTAQQFMYKSGVYFEKTKGNKYDEAVFFHEDGDKWDLTSTYSNGAYVIENWWGGVRTPANLGEQRHTFVKRRGKNEYEYLGIYKIEAIFDAPDSVKIQPDGAVLDGAVKDAFIQLTLWKRV